MVSTEALAEASGRISEGRGVLMRVSGGRDWALYPDFGGWYVETPGYRAWHPVATAWYDSPPEREPSIQIRFYDGPARSRVLASMGWLAKDLSAIEPIEPNREGACREVIA